MHQQRQIGGNEMRQSDANVGGRRGREFVDAVRADLDEWARQLAAGKLSKSDFDFLVRGKKDLAEMNALTQAGLAAVRIERIRTASIDLITTAASKLV